MLARRVLLIRACSAIAAGAVAPATTLQAARAAEASSSPCFRPAPIPAEVRAELGLDPFYVQHVAVGELAIVGSARVSPFAIAEAAWLVQQMLGDRHDITGALRAARCRLAVMACHERTTDIPEHADLEPASYWNRRARGLGATAQRPAVSCGEENLLGFQGDPYAAESILVHELAHAVHELGLSRVDPSFDGRLAAAYRDALDRGLWRGTYAARNRHEYWAEAVQSWFDTNRPVDHDHNHVSTRAELEDYDPALAALVAEVYGRSSWRYTPVARRRRLPHLADYDPQTAPRFAWATDE